MSSHQSVGTKQKAAAATAGALGARTARACDGCLKWRARWYCAADDAFLCQPCDSSVHSANPVARRHHRVRIKVASSSSSPSSSPSVTPSSPLSLGASEDDEEPAWIHGFKRKARTPRGKPGAAAKAEPLVPDLESLSDDDDQQQQLLYRVPVFDPVLAEFCSPPPAPLDDEYPSAQEDTKPMVQTMSLDCKAAPGGLGVCALADADCLAGLHPSDMDLEEFAADMESLLGQNLDDDAFCIDALALMESDVLEADMNAIDKRKVKMEAVALDVACCGLDVEFDISKEALDLEPGYMSPTATGPIEEEHKAVPGATVALTGIKSKRILRLDYEAVIAAWSSNGSSPSPWTGGERPQFCLDDRWPESRGTWLGRGGDVQGALYGSAGLHAAMGGGDGGGREAKVTRYREKRRTRLFSKKIRYEVRKLNAEKRPRMKGRFVKRSPPPPSVAGIAAVPYVY